jgi:hypothetical protein
MGLEDIMTKAVSCTQKDTNSVSSLTSLWSNVQVEDCLAEGTRKWGLLLSGDRVSV